MRNAGRALAILTTLAAALGLAQCEAPRPEAPAEAPPPEPAPASPPSLGQATALNRTDVIALLAQAASDYAAGRSPDQALAGRRFAVRLALGCRGPEAAPRAPRAGRAEWRWTEGRDAVELRLAPADWLTGAPTPSGDLAPAWSRAEGIWIPRPWLSRDDCPAPRPDAPATAGGSASGDGTPAGPPPPEPDASAFSMGLMAYAPEDASRLGRRAGQPYVHLIRGGDQPPVFPVQGWRLLTEGRIGTFPDGRSARCHAPDPDHRPVCLLAVQIDRVAFEEAGGRVLAEWREG